LGSCDYKEENVKKGESLKMEKDLSKTLEVQKKINSLIRSLYKESGDVDSTKLKELGLDKEPVNWGNLECTDVEIVIVAYVGEASPNAVKFKEWLENELSKEEYNITVITEW